MIKKIKHVEYMKAYDAMNDIERNDYHSRVTYWLNDSGKRLQEMTDRPMAKAQNILQFSIRWSESDVKIFADGVRLLSALVGVTETWLPSQLYAKSSGRAVRKIIDVLSTVTCGAGRKKTRDRHEAESQITGGKPAAKPQGTVAIRSTAATNGTASAKGNTEAAKSKTVEPAAENRQQTLNFLTPAKKTNVPVRPKHIDQYAHLFPAKTQEHAAQYGPLMREMDDARENLRLLINNPEASSTSRESLAKKITKIDGQVKAIREELDSEWAKLVEQGRVVVDDLGQAHVVPDAGTGQQTAEPSGTVAESDSTTTSNDEKDWTPEKKKRMDQLRKFLRDRRLPDNNREAYAEKFREYHDELVRDFGAEYVTKTMQENAKTLGIEFAE